MKIRRRLQKNSTAIVQTIPWHEPKSCHGNARGSSPLGSLHVKPDIRRNRCRMSYRVFSIPRKVRIREDIDFPGPVVIDGIVIGDVSCMSLVVGEDGIVDGTIRADTVTVLGEVTGEIFATHITLKPSSAVAANIFHKHLSVENGCLFEGNSRRHVDPLQLT